MGLAHTPSRSSACRDIRWRSRLTSRTGMVALLLVGLPDTALLEARDRIRSAIVNSRETWPTRRITLTLSPASLPKRGSGFDLGIAVAILAASGTLPAAGLDDLVLIGELGLDGRIRPVPGVLPAAAAAAAAGFGAVAVAAENAAEAALVPELRVIAAPSLAAFTAWFRTGQSSADPVVQVLEPGRDIGAAFDVVRDAAPGSRVPKAIATATEVTVVKDLADLVGQPVARPPAEICAAGGHHLMLLGPPGVGKPMLDIKHQAMAACVRGRVRHYSWLARRSKPARSPARGQCAVRRRRQVQRTPSIGAAGRSLISRCRPRFAARSRDLQRGCDMTRAADPLSAAIRICPLIVTMMARDVITERGPHPGSLRRESAAERLCAPRTRIE